MCLFPKARAEDRITLPAVKRVEKAIRAKVQLQQGQDEDDDEELGDERPGSHVWGKSNKALYGADTQDYEVTLPQLGQASRGCRPAVKHSAACRAAAVSSHE